MSADTGKTLYTAGYGAGWTVEALDAAMRERHAVLVDTRLVPFSRKPGWGRDALSAHFGPRRYVHIKALGNLNYRGGPVELADAGEGIESLAARLAEPGIDAVVLLCGCRDVRTCHRKVVAELAAERLGDRFALRIEHLEPPVSASPGWKCLSIRQPWAWAILHGGKDIENRSWKTDYRGPVLIHAAKTLTQAEYTGACLDIGIMAPRLDVPRHEDLERGGIVGAARIVDCVDRSESPWFGGGFGFVLADPRPLPFLPLTGRLGLFEVREADLAPIAAALVRANYREIELERMA
ncbi:DUF488 family protein [Methylomagnum ishizawai]|uniref:DUF488 family protein n=1 Tax=Methylomagnum ishizawai TaxID=1760988 RepID=UPI001C331EC4|nr:DUF488 family protein [Methylomagnum ishizawai]BBL75475.1 hypothetical protein MishRS11D_25730 [Methylomagnum ishizawai]